MGRPGRGDALPISAVTADAYRVPTATRPESDGTHEWDSTGLVVAHVEAGGVRGMGYGYIHQAGAALIRDDLAPAIHGLNAVDIPRAWDAMRARMRNVGLAGLVMSAIAVIDIALWDLKSRLLDLAVSAFSAPRAAVMAHAFAEYDVAWFEEPVPSDDRAGLRRVRAASPPGHTAPQLDAHVCPAAPGCLHAEYFHDHARVDSMLFDGVIEPRDGVLRPDRARPGHGLTFKAADAEPFRVS